MKIEHLAIYVKDLEGARNFFETYFQTQSNQLYHNPKTGFRSYFLSFTDGARLEIMSRPDTLDLAKAANRTGLAHFAMSLGNRKAVDDLTKRLEADGYKCINGPRTTGDGYYESVILGFEDNTIELTV
ncbi:VOC family protein [Streptococcus tangpeifui]|uniref:VOC family protein n=1 Tax=Streptococcus tangpeifui TaxID=2709400 RepID=UPI0013ED7850|nr:MULTISPECIES: VOC family protein [unclassified Streptococcus]